MNSSRTPLLAAALALVGAAACGGDEAPPKDDRPIAEPAVAPAATGPANLDAFGNLLGSDDVVLGFEMPMGAEKTKTGGVGRYLDTTVARMQRFFKSRGYKLEDQVRGWKLTHTDRTLKRYASDSPDALAKASAYVTRGPGPGLSVIFDSGIPKQLATPALQDLIDAERELAQAGGDAKKAEPGQEEAPPGMVRVGPKSQTRPEAKRPRVLGPSELKRLRDAALSRKPKDPKAADISDRVYEWSKSNDGKRFLD